MGILAVFEQNRNGNGVVTRCAEYGLKGPSAIVAFPVPTSPSPKPGELWEVEVLSKNKDGNAMTVRPIKRLGTGHLVLSKYRPTVQPPYESEYIGESRQKNASWWMVFHKTSPTTGEAQRAIENLRQKALTEVREQWLEKIEKECKLLPNDFPTVTRTVNEDNIELEAADLYHELKDIWSNSSEIVSGAHITKMRPIAPNDAIRHPEEIWVNYIQNEMALLGFAGGHSIIHEAEEGNKTAHTLIKLGIGRAAADGWTRVKLTVDPQILKAYNPTHVYSIEIYEKIPQGGKP